MGQNERKSIISVKRGNEGKKSARRGWWDKECEEEKRKVRKELKGEEKGESIRIGKKYKELYERKKVECYEK